MMLLDKVKIALRLTTNAYDDELLDLILAGIADLGLVGVSVDSPENDVLVVRAVVTYCRLNFGTPSDYDRLKQSYDEQKAQLISSSLYTLREVIV